MTASEATSSGTWAGDRLVTVTLTEWDLHVVCNAADHAAWIWKQQNDGTRDESIAIVKRVTEAMRVAWVEQVTA